MAANNQNPTQSDNQANTTGNVKRTFLIGDEWLYYKFYSGPKTADLILTDLIKPLTEQLLSGEIIDRWFFIRYSDPKLHTRVRFHIPDPRQLGAVIQAVNSVTTSFIEQNLIWKVQVDTYQREIERYGTVSMELGEEQFFYDSKMIVDMVSMIEGDEGERLRWLFALRTVDALLNDFHYDAQMKYDWVTTMRENFGREHNMNRALKMQMEKKFRADRNAIKEFLDRKEDEKSEYLPLFQLIDQKSEAVKPLVKAVLEIENKKMLGMPLMDLLSSYSHMTINRLFKSKQRTHELVVYDFLHRYYKSEIARQKYSKINAQKAKKKKK